MKMDQVEELLALIQSIDRKPFPANAAGAWFPIMDGIRYTDAVQAVNDHYKSFGARDSRGEVRPILPVDIRARAHAIAEARARASARSALPGPRQRVGSVGRPQHVEAELAAARRAVAEALAKHERQAVAA